MTLPHHLLPLCCSPWCMQVVFCNAGYVLTGFFVDV